MTAKKYLQQLRLLDLKIKHKQTQARELRQKAYINSSATDGDRVQTSTSGDKLLNAVAAYVDLESEIESMVAHYFLKKNEIINMIHSLDNELFVSILHKRYVEYKSFERIAIELSHAYKYIINVHGTALSEIQKKLNNVEQM